MRQNNDKILRNFTLPEFDMKLDLNSELGENLVATAASAGEAEGGYGRVLRYPQFARVCHLRPVISLRLYSYGRCSVTRPAYNPLA